MVITDSFGCHLSEEKEKEGAVGQRRKTTNEGKSKKRMFLLLEFPPREGERERRVRRKETRQK